MAGLRSKRVSFGSPQPECLKAAPRSNSATWMWVFGAKASDSEACPPPRMQSINPWWTGTHCDHSASYVWTKPEPPWLCRDSGSASASACRADGAEPWRSSVQESTSPSGYGEPRYSASSSGRSILGKDWVNLTQLVSSSLRFFALGRTGLQCRAELDELI